MPLLKDETLYTVTHTQSVATARGTRGKVGAHGNVGWWENKKKTGGLSSVALKSQDDTQKKMEGRYTKETRLVKRETDGIWWDLLLLFYSCSWLNKKGQKTRRRHFRFLWRRLICGRLWSYSFSNAIFISKMEGKYSFLNMLLKVIMFRAVRQCRVLDGKY